MTPALMWERGRARWPGIDLPLDVFAARAGAEADPQHAEDLYLACACAARVAGAAAAFRAEHRDALLTFLVPVVKDRATAIELADELIVELAVGVDGEPRLAAYGGRGPLRAWLRMTAVRRALNAGRDRDRRAELDAGLLRDAVLATADPEVAYLKQRYGRELDGALRDALAELPAPQRALLALHHKQGLPLDTIAAMNRWSKPTASRRVAAAREALLEAACALLRRRLNLSDADVDSLLRLVRSQIDVSMSGLFK